MNIVFFVFIASFFSGAFAKEWCKAVPEYGKPDFAVCVPEGQATAPYIVEVTPVVAPGVILQTDVSIVISGTNGRHTKPIKIASEAFGTSKRVHAERADVGDPLYIRAITTGLQPWRCQKVTIWKDFRYWIFDCIGTLGPFNQDATYTISGNKKYEASIQTGYDINAGTAGAIEITLVGSSKTASPKSILQNPQPGSHKTLMFKAADVGDIESVVLTNTANDDPWFCEYVRIVTEEGNAYNFKVNRWIGAPFNSVSIPLKPSDIELPSQDVDCYTRAADIYSRKPTGFEMVKVRCPSNCQASEFSRILGSTIHPTSSSICAAAILDGTISPSGGEVVVSIVPSIPSYSGTKYQGVESADFEQPPERLEPSFYLYRSDSVDDLQTSVRIIDEFGKLSSTGRLEVKRNGSWGTVCKKGDLLKLNMEAAVKACQQLGYKHGSVIDESCSSVDNHNYCAGEGYPVSVAGVSCSGQEKTIEDCAFEEPSANCADHANDAVVRCTNFPSDVEPSVGTLRIVDSTGAPALDGTGRLEVYNNGFGTVCADGWSRESEIVACRQLGYIGVKNGGSSEKGCSDINGTNYCGPEDMKIGVVNVACKGDEPSIRHCPHLISPDIYCVHDEDIAVSCEGDGDPSGIGLFKKEGAPKLPKAPLKKITLGCTDRPVTRPEMNGPPGSIILASCPNGCLDAPGAIKGTYVYTDDSPICKAAIHTGTIPANGGDILVQIGHPQKLFFGSPNHEILSESSGPYQRSYVVSKVVSQLRERIPQIATSTVQVPRFAETKAQEALESKLLEDKFHWFTPENWEGFNGKPQDYVDTSNLPGSSLISSFRDFTLTARVTVTGKSGSWRAILAHSDCDGFLLAIDTNDEVIFEQTCRPSYVASGFKPQLGESFHVAVTYFAPEKAVAIFINGKKAVYQKTDYVFNLKSKLIIGRANATQSEYFVGDINAVRIFDYVLAPNQIRRLIVEGEKSQEPAKPSRGPRRTDDGRVCLSPCSVEEPEELESKIKPTNAAIKLTCLDTLDNPSFNGATGQKFLVSCPADCAHSSGSVHGCKVYTPCSSICKAALHNGAIQRTGGETILTIHNGLPSYTASRGHYGVISTAVERPTPRSFSVTKAPHYKSLTCLDDGNFVLKLGIEERDLVICPSGCANIVGAGVFGSGIYSPISSVCRAAIHAGVLNDNGGEVEIEAGPQHSEFVGSEINGIVSQNSGNYLRSFTFVRPEVSQE